MTSETILDDLTYQIHPLGLSALDRRLQLNLSELQQESPSATTDGALPQTPQRAPSEAPSTFSERMATPGRDLGRLIPICFDGRLQCTTAFVLSAFDVRYRSHDLCAPMQETDRCLKVSAATSGRFGFRPNFPPTCAILNRNAATEKTLTVGNPRTKPGRLHKQSSTALLNHITHAEKMVLVYPRDCVSVYSGFVWYRRLSPNPHFQERAGHSINLPGISDTADRRRSAVYRHRHRLQKYRSHLVRDRRNHLLQRSLHRPDHNRGIYRYRGQ